MHNSPEFQPKLSKEEILAQLSPKEAAIFMLAEHLLKIEQEGNKARLQIYWNNGLKTGEVIGAAYCGDLFAFPAPTPERYSLLQWEWWPQQGKMKGSGDIRIYDQERLLYFLANQNSFEGMEKDWAEAVDNIPYPILVEDRYGFRHVNPSCRKLLENSGAKKE